MSVAIIAHRGASGITGEDNTLRSFRLAIDLGCDFVETDVRRTRDGQLVCFHDEAVPAGRVRDLTLEELRAASGIDVPTLEDTVRLFEPKEAGHPLKVAAHVAHPAGYILYHGVARPVHWFMSLPGLRHVFGHTEDAIQEDPWESRTSH